MTNSVDPDQILHFASSDLGLQFATGELMKYVQIREIPQHKRIANFIRHFCHKACVKIQF